MSHPLMVDPDDPWLTRVRTIALAFPDADEKISHGHPAFFTRKVFAYYGGAHKVDEVWRQEPTSVLVLPDPEDRPALLLDDRVYVPAYLGPSGWLGVRLDDRTDDDELAELLEDSYRLTAGVRRVARLDEGIRR